jgi:hypothetical protein
MRWPGAPSQFTSQAGFWHPARAAASALKRPACITMNEAEWSPDRPLRHRGMSAHPGGPTSMNNHATGSIWQTSKVKLEQQLWGCQGGFVFPETAPQRRHLRQLQTDARQAAAERADNGVAADKESGRAAGERLHRQRCRLTAPSAGSSAKPLPDPSPPYDRAPRPRPRGQCEGPTNQKILRSS